MPVKIRKPECDMCISDRARQFILDLGQTTSPKITQVIYILYLHLSEEAMFWKERSAPPPYSEGCCDKYLTTGGCTFKIKAVDILGENADSV